MNEEESFLKAIKQIRETNTKRKFDQTVDLIVNLKAFDVRREAFSLFINAPNKVKERKVGGFLEKKSKIIDTVTKEEFARFKEKKDFKKLARDYDFFIANAKMMPAVATSFGRVLGPVGKMPSPQLGIVVSEDENVITDLIKKINNTVKIKVKEPSIKVAIACESLTDEQIMRNAIAVYHKLIETLPRKRDNIRNVKIKLTMSPPAIVEI